MAIRIAERNSSLVTRPDERYPRAVTREEFDALLNRVAELEKALAGEVTPATPDRAAYMREYRKRRKADG